MAAQIITIAIEKGGAGKTVTASNLAYLMGDEGKKSPLHRYRPAGKPDKRFERRQWNYQRRL